MIYIDPPYNTGNDFIYRDDFQLTVKKYVKVSKNGEVTVKKGCGKCAIKVLVSCKATENRNAAKKVVTIKVK